MLYDITHRTTYNYGSDVSVSHHLAHLHPRALPWQEVSGFQLDIDPAPTVAAEREDYYGNAAAFFTIDSPHDRLAVTARSRVQVATPRLPVHSPPWEQVRELCASDVFTPDSEGGEFRFDSSYIVRRPMFADYAAPSFTGGRPLLDALIHFNARFFHDFTFDARATTPTGVHHSRMPAPLFNSTTASANMHPADPIMMP